MEKLYLYDRLHNRLFANVKLANGNEYRVETTTLGELKAQLAALLRAGARPA